MLPFTNPTIASYHCKAKKALCGHSFNQALAVLLVWIFVLFILTAITIKFKKFAFIKERTKVE
jgi:hypothetical protein